MLGTASTMYSEYSLYLILQPAKKKFCKTKQKHLNL